MNDIMTILQQKFNSANDVPVTRSSLTRAEYDALIDYIDILNSELMLADEMLDDYFDEVEGE